MTTLPIKLRLTLAFTAVMAVVLAATGLFVHVRMAAGLDEALEDALRSRADEVSALVRRSGHTLEDAGDSRLTDADEHFAQILDDEGRILDATWAAREAPLITDRQLADLEVALTEEGNELLVERVSRPGFDDELRLIARPVESNGQQLAVVVGASLEDRNEALQGLRETLLVGGPATLLLASLAAYVLATGALRPVELMRREATAISVSEPGRRLPVPETNDEIARLGETLNEMLGRLEAALARERILLADASHELRTPLAILKTELELALAEGRSPDELRAAVRSAAEETDLLAQLADDLLVIARASEGRLPVHRAHVSAAELLERVGGRFMPRAAHSGRSIETFAEPGLTLFVDPLRLEQALSNVVDNSLRHGDGTIRVSATALPDGWTLLRVIDEGKGFPDGFAERAFERFTRADDGMARGGTGLGLAVVDAIVAVHGGVAEASNRSEGGAELRLRLPGGDG